MVFWAERFRRDDEEDIWEELKRMITNQLTEEEVFLKKKQEQAWIDSVLDKAFPEGKKDNKNPYLKYEDLLDKPKQKTGDLTGMSVPIQEGRVVYEKRLTPYEEIDAKKDWSEEKKSQKKAEIAKIQEIHDAIEKEINREYILEQAKNYGGAGLEIGSAAVPGYGGAKLAGTVAKKLAPKVGRKIAQEIATGTLKGASAGTVEGLGRGLLEDKNPLKTAMQDTIVGTTLGATGGTISANAHKVIRGKELKKIEDLKLLRKKETDFYKDYIQGTKSRHPQIGNIEYTQSGLETVSKRPNAGRDFDSLKKELNNAEYVNYELPHHKKHGIKDNIRGFHKLKNNSKEFLIADTPDGAKYYMSKKIGDVSNRPSRVEPTSPNNIIQPLQTNFNPSQESVQKPKSFEEWLEELKRRRKKGWW